MRNCVQLHLVHCLFLIRLVLLSFPFHFLLFLLFFLLFFYFFQPISNDLYFRLFLSTSNGLKNVVTIVLKLLFMVIAIGLKFICKKSHHTRKCEYCKDDF